MTWFYFDLLFIPSKRLGVRKLNATENTKHAPYRLTYITVSCFMRNGFVFYYLTSSQALPFISS